MKQQKIYIFVGTGRGRDKDRKKILGMENYYIQKIYKHYSTFSEKFRVN